MVMHESFSKLIEQNLREIERESTSLDGNVNKNSTSTLIFISYIEVDINGSCNLCVLFSSLTSFLPLPPFPIFLISLLKKGKNQGNKNEI